MFMILNKNNRTSLIASAVIFSGSVALLSQSCGRQDKESSDSTESTLLEWKSQPYSQRFTQNEIDQVHSTATKTVAGKTFPASKAALKKVYDDKTANAAFKAEWGEFTAGAEVKGFINLGVAPSKASQERLLKNFESVSTWKSIKDSSGKQVFKDIYAVDASGNKTADKVDGKASATGDLIPLKLFLNSPIGAISVLSMQTLYQRGNEVQSDLINTQNINVPLIGTLIKYGNLKIHLKFFPYQKGYLVYGASKVKLESHKDALKPEDLIRNIDSIYNWLVDRVVLPL